MANDTIVVEVTESTVVEVPVVNNTVIESAIPGVVSVVAPITNTGSSTSAIIGVNQDGFDHIASLNYAQFNTSNLTPPATTGRMAWNQGDGTLDVKLMDGVTLQMGQEMVAMCANYTGSLIPEGSAVHVLGAQGQRLKIALASASSEALSANTLGVVTQSGGIAHGSSGYVTTTGVVRGLHLPKSSFADGDILWLGVASGTWSRTRPVAPNHGVQIGYVINASNGNSGQIYVNVQNGYELDELHNVKIINPQNGDVLKYQASTGVWVNVQPAVIP